jgi:crotonobetainyl-CoA:carnitine CoA-transferase CaiB-like acyl-CoA transferase
MMKLEGIRVVDLSQFLPGPHLTMLMADQGAEVINVETPGAGEPTRSIGLKQGGTSVYFRNTSRGKKSLSVNLKNDDGREALLRLIETADVVLETFRPGVDDAVKKRAPKVVYCSISAFGQDSPMKNRPAHDLSVLALAGVASLTLGQDNKPAMPGSPPSDMSASLMALSGILMALLRAEKTGQGDYLDIAMQDCVMSWLPYTVGPVFAERRAPEPKMERLFGGAALYGIYETKDGQWMTMGGSEAKFATNLLEGLGRPDLIPAAHDQPGPAQIPVVDFLRETFKNKDMAEWLAWFEGRDICYAPILDLKTAFDQPNVAARDMLLTDDGGNLHIGHPIKFRDEPAEVDLSLADLGQDNAAIMRDIGYDDAQIAQMQESGALFQE